MTIKLSELNSRVFNPAPSVSHLSAARSYVNERVNAFPSGPNTIPPPEIPELDVAFAAKNNNLPAMVGAVDILIFAAVKVPLTVKSWNVTLLEVEIACGKVNVTFDPE